MIVWDAKAKLLFSAAKVVKSGSARAVKLFALERANDKRWTKMEWSSIALEVVKDINSNQDLSNWETRYELLLIRKRLNQITKQILLLNMFWRTIFLLNLRLAMVPFPLSFYFRVFNCLFKRSVVLACILPWRFFVLQCNFIHWKKKWSRRKIPIKTKNLDYSL